MLLGELCEGLDLEPDYMVGEYAEGTGNPPRAARSGAALLDAGTKPIVGL